ncbi:MAG: DUF4342 domain-containing protein [Desulfitobacterium sp.]|nr:DUF4342 domain-containing protein [Desulfitobacterium sp.]
MSPEKWTELEKIDTLRTRFDLTYEEAQRILARANGDLIQALSDYEKEKLIEDGLVGQFWQDSKGRLNRFCQTQVKLKRRDKTILSVNAPLGLALAYGIWRRPNLRVLALVGATAAAFRDYKLEIESIMDDEDFYPYGYTPNPMYYDEVTTELN